MKISWRSFHMCLGPRGGFDECVCRCDRLRVMLSFVRPFSVHLVKEAFPSSSYILPGSRAFHVFITGPCVEKKNPVCVNSGCFSRVFLKQSRRPLLSAEALSEARRVGQSGCFSRPLVCSQGGKADYFGEFDPCRNRVHRNCPRPCPLQLL